MRLRTGTAGYSLPEVLIVMTLSTVILGATLTTFANFNRNEQQATQLNEQIERARNGLDLLARQLRNLARPLSSGSTTAATINRAQGYDFIFQTSAPQRTWVRYCMATSGTLGGRPVSADRAVVYEAASASATLTTAMGGACPGTGWASVNTITDVAVNRTAGFDRPLFSYVCPGLPACGTDLLKVKGVRSDLYVDLDVSKRPLAQQVSTAVFLRNQNEPPVAAATWRPAGAGTVALNASGSSDPEERTLTHFWFDGPVPSLWNGCQPGTPPALSGISATLAGTSATTRTINLVVCDPGGLRSQQALTVSFP